MLFENVLIQKLQLGFWCTCWQIDPWLSSFSIARAAIWLETERLDSFKIIRHFCTTTNARLGLKGAESELTDGWWEVGAVLLCTKSPDHNF